jgi:hypothetical protein
MKKRIKVLSSIVILLCVSVSTVLSQGDEDRSPLPKGAKLKAIVYDNQTAIGIGYVYKNEFVENQRVTFYDVPEDAISPRVHEGSAGFSLLYDNKEIPLTSLSPTVSGIYYTEAGQSWVRGTWHSSSDVVKGTFKFANSELGDRLTPRPRDIDFNLEVVDVTFSQEETEREKIHRRRQPDGTYYVKVEYSAGSGIKTVEVWTPELLTVHDGDRRFAENFPQSRVVYKNGDTFVGAVDLDRNGRFTPGRGTFTYATGETFTGSYRPIELTAAGLQIPEGETVFSDGTRAEGNWLSKYNFTSAEWKELYESCSTHSLTEIRDSAIRFDSRKQVRLQQEKEEQLARERQKQEEARAADARRAERDAIVPTVKAALAKLKVGTPESQLSKYKIDQNFFKITETRDAHGTAKVYIPYSSVQEWFSATTGGMSLEILSGWGGKEEDFDRQLEVATYMLVIDQVLQLYPIIVIVNGKVARIIYN